MAAMQSTFSTGRGLVQPLPARVAAFRPVARGTVLTKAAFSTDKFAQKAAAMVGAAGLLAAPAHAEDALEQASQVAAQVAQSTNDNRALLIAALMTPAVGWVLFNILEPALNQYKNMQTRSLAAGLGMSAAMMLLADQANAANEVAELAAGDNRLLVLLVIFVPALGWVAFNILGPALNQFANMADADGPKKGGKRR